MGEYQALHYLRRDANFTSAFVLTSLRKLERPTFWRWGRREEYLQQMSASSMTCMFCHWHTSDTLTSFQVAIFYIMVPFPFPFPFPFIFIFLLSFLLSFYFLWFFSFPFSFPLPLLFSLPNALFLCLQLQARSIYHNSEIPQENKKQNCRRVCMSKWDILGFFSNLQWEMQNTGQMWKKEVGSMVLGYHGQASPKWEPHLMCKFWATLMVSLAY